MFYTWSEVVFEVGPSVKFVSAIKDAIFKKKNGGNFFFFKNGKRGGGVRGECGKRPHFFRVFFSRTLPLSHHITRIFFTI